MKLKLTSVKVSEKIYNEAKRKFIGTDMNFQKLVNKSLIAWVKDSKELINFFETHTVTTGSIGV